MKKAFFITIMMLIGYQFASGYEIKFSYDMSGNRIKRELVADSVLEQQKHKILKKIGSVEMTSDKISVTPNPTDGQFRIYLNNLGIKGRCDISIYSYSGQVLFQKSYNENEIDVNISSFSAGAYLLLIKIDNDLYTKKIIKL